MSARKKSHIEEESKLSSRRKHREAAHTETSDRQQQLRRFHALNDPAMAMRTRRNALNTKARCPFRSIFSLKGRSSGRMGRHGERPRGYGAILTYADALV
uniref:(northern house mosquito) hypothetical protein n=1 Tax=Culex pipiens TaxID=7175 RepID=A0A8D8JET7_CULPI